ncbi:uncharacterized protein LOC131216249 [Anopheles bellator]|uniref:uncharacterized protein LOC131216249 n=1 Tax=Anopheles bellator TaxID=139047 RepID=UPI00264710E2|nr:uncharacterized protein LOC131216249 [Anopheles bellator]
MWPILLVATCVGAGLATNTSYDPDGKILIGIVIVHEKEQSEVPSLVASALARATGKLQGMVSVEDYYIEYDRDRAHFADDEQFCGALHSGGGVSLLLDVTWIHARYVAEAAARFGIPYLHLDLSVQTYVKLMENFLLARSGTDVVYILPSAREADAAIYFLITDSALRAIVFDRLDARTAERIRAIRPYPTFYAVIAPVAQMGALLDQAVAGGLVRKPEKWNLLYTDLLPVPTDGGDDGPLAGRSECCVEMNRLLLDSSTCCMLLQHRTGPDCDCPARFDPIVAHLDNVLEVVLRWSTETRLPLVRAVNCSSVDDTSPAPEIVVRPLFDQLATMPQFWIAPAGPYGLIRPNLNYSIVSPATARNLSRVPDQPIGSLARGEVRLMAAQGTSIPRTRRFFRVGTAEALPWAYRKRHPTTGDLLIDPRTGGPVWEGYCIDFIHQLSVVMNFDYDLVSPSDGTFGARNATDGRWNGLVGDLVSGDIDFAVTALKMTAEREEVIDFVAPYFEQTGILIVMRKPVRETSLFKFMTVLRLEVWMSILLAIVATAVMLSLLDRFSPYSAKNNREAYPYECRDFTLKESFWFALTSFTPQGGGEAPKALSGRTLVAAYWLFVVLMLATFTANLAAFLTVERMQTPVQSLEQLSRQSRIKYTVVNGSDTHDFFRNMKNAEDVLYQMWRNLTLASGNDQAQYRVWDYPVREQYINILTAIESADPVATAEDGFRRVNAHLEADFAFIHDSAEIRYAISRDCNLTEVGEVFAEQPYAVAVQQGSQLQDELSYYILQLQSDRFFELLTPKYWNNSARGQCPNTDDSEGITLESLGGVFIATLVGLALAMITLLVEVLYYRRKQSRAEQSNIVQVAPAAFETAGAEKITGQFALKEKSIAAAKKLLLASQPPVGDNGGNLRRVKRANDKPIPKDVTIGSKFISAAEQQQRLSYISITPRKPLH